jgi:phosphopantetheine adenylyltransferase
MDVAKNDKAKPVARQGRKATGFTEIAGMPTMNRVILGQITRFFLISQQTNENGVRRLKKLNGEKFAFRNQKTHQINLFEFHR